MAQYVFFFKRIPRILKDDFENQMNFLLDVQHSGADSVFIKNVKANKIQISQFGVVSLANSYTQHFTFSSCGCLVFVPPTECEYRRHHRSLCSFLARVTVRRGTH